MGRAMKDSGILWIGEIPQEWDTIKLKRCFSERNGGAWGNDPVRDKNDVICIRVADFDYQRMCVKNQDNYTERNYEPHIIEKLKLQKGDILIEKSGGGELTPVGRTIIFDKDFDALYANFIDRVRVCDKFIPKFMQYIFVAFYKNNFTKLYIKQTTGIQNLDITSMFSNERCVLTNIDIQQFIADYLDGKCKEIDSIIENTKETIEEYKKYKQSVITEAVTKGINPNAEMKDSGIDWIGQIPKHWEMVRIQRLFYTVDERNENPDMTLLSLYTAIGVKPRSELEEKGNKPITVMNYKIVRVGDLVVNKLLAWMGAISYSDYKGATSPDYDVYREVKDANVFREYYNSYFRYTKFKDDCYKYGHGIMLMRWRTYPSEFLRILVPNPPYSEQQEISEYLYTRCSEIDILILKKQQIITELESYKKSLIYECVTGKRNVEVLENVQTTIIYPLFPAILATDKKRFAQAVLASKVIDAVNTAQFGRVKLEKILYTLETHIGFYFDTNYKRQVAGPLDGSIYQCEDIICRKNKWFNIQANKKPVEYSPANGIADYKKYYSKYFADYNSEVERIINIFRPLSHDQAEIIATLYASWNDFIIDGKAFTDDDIVNDVLNNWNDSKKRFPEDTWLREIEHMRKLDLVPKGYGKKTIKAKGGVTSGRQRKKV